MKLSPRLICLALAALMLGSAPALPVFAQANAAVQAPVDPAKVDIGVKIFREIHFLEILTMGAKQGLMENPEVAGLAAPERDKLFALLDEEMQKREATMARKLAAANVGPYTLAELNDILTVVKIKYVQEIIMQGADPTRPNPDPAMMTPAEQAVVAKIDQMPYVTKFLGDFAFGDISTDISEAVAAAVERYVATLPAQK